MLAAGNSSLAASDCLFADAESAGDGGALLALDRSRIALQRCAFRNCSSLGGSGGGAAALLGSAISASACSFSSCSAQWGGALSAVNQSTVTVDGASTFTSCSAWYGGGVSARWGSALSVRGSAFTSCRGENSGGATAAAYFSESLVEGCQMASCSASRGGGSSALYYSSALLRDTAIADGVSRFDGGCAFARLMANLTMVGVRCVRGTAMEDSAAGSGSGGGFSGAHEPHTSETAELPASPGTGPSPPQRRIPRTGLAAPGLSPPYINVALSLPPFFSQRT